MPGLFCGVDIGTTNLKAVFLDGDGRLVFSQTAATPRVADGARIATDALALVGVLEGMIIAGWRQCGGGAPLRAISTAGAGEDGFGVTRDLRPMGHAIPWFDNRAQAEAEELACFPHVAERAGLVMDPYLTGAKWLWLSRHRPLELETAAHWVTLTDYPLVRWSGRAFMSLSLAPRTGCFNIYNRQWIPGLLAACHAPSLPPLLAAGAAVGYMGDGPLTVSGAASLKTVLVAGGHDHPMAATALRRLVADARVDSLGTANLVYGEVPLPERARLGRTITFSLPPDGAPGLACHGITHFAETLEPLRKDRAAFDATLGLPRMPGAPGEDVGILPGLRPALEHAALRARAMFAEMRELGLPRAPIYMTGGWSRSRAIAELRASVFGETVHVVEDVELAALSAALFAAECATSTTLDLAPLLRPRPVEPVAEWAAAYANMPAFNGRDA